MKKIIIAAMTALMSVSLQAEPAVYRLCSPNAGTVISVDVNEGIRYSVEVGGNVVLAPSVISMTLEDGTVYGGPDAGMPVISKRMVDKTIDAVVYRKSKVADSYSEMTLKYRDFRLEFRAYDDGVAYRFVSASEKPFKVVSEQAQFSFPEDWMMYVPYVCQNVGTMEGQFHNSYENRYAHEPLSSFNTSRYAFLPLVVEAAGGVKLCISESDLLHYPGMYLYNGNGSTTLQGVFAPYPKDRVPEPGNRIISMYVNGREDYIAKCEAGCSFPWRLIGISTSDRQLLDNDIVYRLASPAAPDSDFSWVKPGKVAWDWWNAWNIYGVDFKSGINTETYKYYIDFASSFGVEYIILDEGWSPVSEADLYQVVPEIDLDELISYGASKNVGIILWAGFYPFQKDIEGYCKYYSEKGVKGFKVDFMDSDDQQIPEFLEKSAATASRYHLMMDYHGIYKPTGLSRKYPNIVNYEGVYGLENMKWSASAEQVEYDVTIPYIRLFAGPADYTQGAMRNACKSNIRSCGTEAMSAGTRCRQLAEYVVFFSPLNMLCDAPTNYMAEPECTRFIASVPTVWDETVSLDGEIGKFAAIARRSGNEWFVGAMTDWDERDLTLDLSFLGEGRYEVTAFKDGANADRAARDYKKETFTLPESRKIQIHLAPGGGYAARIIKK